MFEDSLIYPIKNSFIKGEEERGKGGGEGRRKKRKEEKTIKSKRKIYLVTESRAMTGSKGTWQDFPALSRNAPSLHSVKLLFAFFVSVEGMHRLPIFIPRWDLFIFEPESQVSWAILILPR